MGCGTPLRKQHVSGRLAWESGQAHELLVLIDAESKFPGRLQSSGCDHILNTHLVGIDYRGCKA